MLFQNPELFAKFKLSVTLVSCLPSPFSKVIGINSPTTTKSRFASLSKSVHIAEVTIPISFKIGQTLLVAISNLPELFSKI